jgi:hypothetical protein
MARIALVNTRGAPRNDRSGAELEPQESLAVAVNANMMVTGLQIE